MVYVLLMWMVLVAILVETLFSMWKFVPAKIGVPIFFTTRVEKVSFDDLHEKVVCISPSMVRSYSLST